MPTSLRGPNDLADFVREVDSDADILEEISADSIAEYATSDSKTWDLIADFIHKDVSVLGDDILDDLNKNALVHCDPEDAEHISAEAQDRIFANKLAEAALDRETAHKVFKQIMDMARDGGSFDIADAAGASVDVIRMHIAQAEKDAAEADREAAAQAFAQAFEPKMVGDIWTDFNGKTWRVVKDHDSTVLNPV